MIFPLISHRLSSEVLSLVRPTDGIQPLQPARHPLPRHQCRSLGTGLADVAGKDPVIYPTLRWALSRETA